MNKKSGKERKKKKEKKGESRPYFYAYSHRRLELSPGFLVQLQVQSLQCFLPSTIALSKTFRPFLENTQLVRKPSSISDLASRAMPKFTNEKN